MSKWWTRAVIYELYVDKFAGNFRGLTSKLDYFSYLGINTLWLLPHYPSPMVDGGYDVSDYCGIRTNLGTMADFDNFIETAHQKGLKVIIDLVLNHTSVDHPWFIQARSSRDNPKRDWYLWSGNQDKFSGAFVHFAETKGKNWIPNETTGDYYYATFYKEQPDLNWDNPEVMKQMLSVVNFWLDRGVDGFRLDAVSRLVKRDGTSCFGLPETHQIIKNIRSHIETKNPDTVLLAESGGWSDEARPYFGSGDECQLVLHFPLSVRLLSSVRDHDLTTVNELLKSSGQLPQDCRWAVFLTSHDNVDLNFLINNQARQNLINQIDPRGIWTQSGSTSISARLADVYDGNIDDIVWVTKAQLDQSGTPVIYYGNEIGMRNLSLPEKPADTRDFVRGPFDWAEAEKQKSDPGSLLNSISAIIKNRQILQ